MHLQEDDQVNIRARAFPNIPYAAKFHIMVGSGPYVITDSFVDFISDSLDILDSKFGVL